MMKMFLGSAKRFWARDNGANALEYALVLILVAFAITGGAGALGTALNGLFSATANQVSTVTVPTL